MNTIHQKIVLQAGSFGLIMGILNTLGYTKNFELFLWGIILLGSSILVLKKGNQIIEFDLGHSLIINNDQKHLIKGVFESMTKDYLSIRTDLSQKEIPISSITKINVQDTVSISFADGLLAGAGSCILPIAILSIGNPEAHYGIVFASIAAPIMAVIGGLTSLILPKRVRTKMYLIKENAWEIVND